MDFTQKEYSTPDQPLRVAQAKETNNQRFLDIDQFYKPELVKGKKVLVTGLCVLMNEWKLSHHDNIA